MSIIAAPGQSTRQTCQTCRFWRRDDAESGLCRRHAPRPARQHGDGVYFAVFPLVENGDWCGEHEPIDAAA
jgi:hypothetical protein